MKTKEKNEYKVGDFVLPVSLKFTNHVCELTEDLGYDFKYKTKFGGWGVIDKSYLPTRWRLAEGDEIKSGIASQIQIVKSFIAEYGLLRAMEVLKNAPEGSTHHDLVTAENLDLYFNSKDHLEWCEFELRWCLPRFHYTNEMIMGMMDIAELKRLFENIDLINKVGGPKAAKAQVKQAKEYGYSTFSIPIELNGSIVMGCLNIDKLQQALSDHDQLFENIGTLEVTHV